MNLNFTAAADADLEDIFDFIAADNPAAAERTVTRILQSLAILESFPLLGRPGRVDGVREWSIPGLPYIGFYEIVDEQIIDVLAIVHTSRHWPE